MKKKDVEENLIVDFEKDEEYQALPSLSAREKAFVIEYLRTYDARKAGKKAGIKSGSLNTLPFVWIKKDSIAAHIKVHANCTNEACYMSNTKKYTI